MIAWVIERTKDKKYFTRYETFDELRWATLFGRRSTANYTIDVVSLEGCKPVKVKIEVMKDGSVGD